MASAPGLTDQLHIGRRVRWGATQAHGDDGGMGTGAAANAVQACGVKGFGEGQRRQYGGQATRQHREAEYASPRGFSASSTAGHAKVIPQQVRDLRGWPVFLVLARHRRRPSHDWRDMGALSLPRRRWLPL
jgi:hypothetical protein